MTRRRTRHRMPLVVLVFVFLMTALDVRAQEDGWRFDLTVYGWLPSIRGDLRYALPVLGDEITVRPETLLDNLDFTAMAALAARHGPWSMTADVLFLSEAAQGSARLGPGPGIRYDTELEVDVWIAGLDGSYRLISRGQWTLDLLAGVRCLSADSMFVLRSPGPGFDVGIEASTQIWNGVVGVRGRFALSDRWFVPYLLDVGAGDSHPTWQIRTGLGVDFGWARVVLAWRNLTFDQGEAGWLRDLELSGAELGVVIPF